LSNSASVINGSRRPYEISYQYSLFYRSTQTPLSLLKVIIYVQTYLQKVTLISNQSFGMSDGYKILDITSSEGSFVVGNITKMLNANFQTRTIQYKPFYLGYLYQIQALIFGLNIPSNTYTLMVYYSNTTKAYSFNLLTINLFQPFYLPCSLMSTCTSCGSGYFLTNGKCFTNINNCSNYQINRQFNMMSLMGGTNFYNFDSVFSCSECQTGYISIGNGCV